MVQLIVFCLADDGINLHPAHHHMLVCFGAAVERMVPGEELLPGAAGGRDPGADGECFDVRAGERCCRRRDSISGLTFNREGETAFECHQCPR